MIFALDIMGVLLLSFWRKNHLNGDGVFRGHKTRDGFEAWKYRYHVFLCFGLELCKKFTWNLDQPYTNTFFYPTTFYFMYVVRTYNHHFTKYYCGIKVVVNYPDRIIGEVLEQLRLVYSNCQFASALYGMKGFHSWKSNHYF